MKRVGEAGKVAQVEKQRELMAIHRVYLDKLGKTVASDVFFARREVAEKQLALKDVDRAGSWAYTRLATGAECEEHLKLQPHLKKAYEGVKIITSDSKEIENKK